MNEPAANLLRHLVDSTKQPVWTAQSSTPRPRELRAWGLTAMEAWTMKVWRAGWSMKTPAMVTGGVCDDLLSVHLPNFELW